MISHEIPCLPWQKVASDLFTLNNNDYLVTVDYHSRFFEVDKLRSTTSKAVISKLKSHFARYGIPSILISDNGPQYSLVEFQDFARTWGFTHRISSPIYPQSNSLVEKTVQTAKSLMMKASENGEDPYLGLLEYRNTPVDGLASPSQLLMCRQLRTLLPCTTDHLKKKVVSNRKFLEKRTALQRQQKCQFDVTSRPLLSVEDSTWQMEPSKSNCPV